MNFIKTIINKIKAVFVGAEITAETIISNAIAKLEAHNAQHLKAAQDTMTAIKTLTSAHADASQEAAKATVAAAALTKVL